MGKVEAIKDMTVGEDLLENRMGLGESLRSATVLNKTDER